jgi:hypothetical protein
LDVDDCSERLPNVLMVLPPNSGIPVIDPKPPGDGVPQRLASAGEIVVVKSLGTEADESHDKPSFARNWPRTSDSLASVPSTLAASRNATCAALARRWRAVQWSRRFDSDTGTQSTHRTTGKLARRDFDPSLGFEIIEKGRFHSRTSRICEHSGIAPLHAKGAGKHGANR